MLLQLLLALLAVLLGYAAWCWHSSPRRLRTRYLAARIPGPRAWPLLGNALVFMSKPKDLLNIIGGYFDVYGQYVKFWLGPDLNVCIKNPTDIRAVLTSNKVNEKGPLYQFMKKYIGPGILTGGPTWRNHRKIATPSYSKKSVARFAEIFNAEAERLVEQLKLKDPTITFDVYKDVVRITTQCVCQTLMGLSKEDSMSVKRLEECVFGTQTMYTFIWEKMTRWWLQIPLIFWLTGRKKTEDYYIKLIDDLAGDIVSKKVKAFENNPVIDDESFNIVDSFILSREMSEKEIKFETFTLFTTSQEASAKIASAVLLFLAHLPQWQERVYQEIIEILGAEDDPVRHDQLKRLQHLDMVFREVLRWLSIAAFIQRTVEEEISVKNGELTLPVGASVIIPIHMLHRDPQYWDEPLTVDPARFLPERAHSRDPSAFVPFSLGAMDCLGELTSKSCQVIIPIHMLHRDPQYWDEPLTVDPARFLPERVHSRDPSAFVPFSLGAMDCLGRVYATALIKTLVVRVLRHLELEADGRLEDLDLNVAISVKFANGYNLRVKPRKQGKHKLI